MVGDNKVLTVSYGTFSCTLEGFEDPFSIMKDIAEYFRDLAADDRLFGEKPPLLDLDLLQNLAGKSVKNPVDAKITDNKLVLRQTQTSDIAQPAAAAVAAPLADSTGLETVAQKLQRIREVVARDATQDATFNEDQHVDEVAIEIPAFDNTLENISSEVAAQISAEITETASTDEPTDELIDEPVVEETASEQDDVDDTTSTTPIDMPQFDEAENDALEEVDLTAIANAAMATTHDTPNIEEMGAASREKAAETAIDSVLGHITDESEATPRRRIIVQKITREDLKTAREEAEKAAAAREQDVDTFEVDEDEPLESDLPAEQEEALMRELAALRLETKAAEMTSEKTPTAAQSSSENTMDTDDALASALNELISNEDKENKQTERETARQARRERRDAIVDKDRDDVERLISTTTSRLDNDESSQRRASIAHLKAAVAATKADATLVEAAHEHEARERDQYAEDLARVVRRERTIKSVDRNTTDRPSPLFLVSEQRIDRIETETKPNLVAAKSAAKEAPLLLGRKDIATPRAQDSESGKTSFPDFAKSANAIELNDLLEAAAAHFTFVENTEQFTRPMLMRKIASVESGADFSREAGLKSFGTLLRQGKLLKDGSGKFVIAKTSRFTPEARYAGE